MSPAAVVGASVQYLSCDGCTIAQVFDDGSITVSIPGVGEKRAAAGEWLCLATSKAAQEQAAVGSSPLQGTSSACASTFAGDTPSLSDPTDTPVPEQSRRPIYSLPAREILRRFLLEKETNYLKAWFHYFDKDQNRRISRLEFRRGMHLLHFPGNIDLLFNDLCEAADETDELTFEEIDAREAELWNSFRRWCGSHFSSSRDMIRQLKQAHRCIHCLSDQSASRLSRVSSGMEETVSEEEFAEGVDSLGWDGGRKSGCAGFESVIFQAIDLEHEGLIGTAKLKWLELEVAQYKKKEQAKRRAQKIAEHKAHGFQAMQAALADFKDTLKKQAGVARAGPLFRGWRRWLDPEGSMSCQRPDLFKVCQKLNWKGDVRALWKVLDFDGSGNTTIEEIDPHAARLIANFKNWANKNFGPRPSANLFQTFDRQGARKIRYAQFVSECQARGYYRKAKTLAHWLDWEEKKFLSEEDFQFLDSWKPPAWLTAQSNPQAADDFKNLLLHKYGHFLKAWRGCLDKDNSNCCNWHEFQEAVRILRFPGDMAGAWLHFDEDLSGYITLKEIDPEAHTALVEFKSWADEEFGGVRSAFKVLDADGSNGLTTREFRGACRNFGFQGDTRTLFAALDQEGGRILQYSEIVFLDDWETSMPVSTEALDAQEAQNLPEQVDASLCLDYSTNVPGPGTYEVLSGIGATPIMPTARHGGSYSFTYRRPLFGLRKSVGPARYDPSLEPVVGSKPSWSFGKETREQQRTPRLPSRAASTHGTPRGALQNRFMASPGPGAYEPNKETSSGPRFSMRPRRVLHVHPMERPPSDGRAYSR